MAKQNMTQRDLLIEIKTELVGMDGKGGMRQDISDVKEAGENGRKRLHDKLDDLSKKVVTKEECKTARNNYIEPPKQKKRKAILATRLLEVTIMGGIITIILAILKFVFKVGL
jgi:hypothetical protein